jgi:hypothetical protein
MSANVRRMAIAVAGFSATLALAGTAEARTARFNVTLKGSYSTTGTGTERGCWTVDANDNATQLPPQSGNASETDTFASTRANGIVVSSILGRPPAPGALKLHRLLPVRVTSTRTSSLGSHGGAHGCRPNDGEGDATPDCGTKTRTFGAGVIGVSGQVALSYQFINFKASTLWRPPDPFNGCWLSLAQQWYGFALDHGAAKVSASKLFNPHLPRIVLTGKRSGHRSRTEGELSGTATFSEHYTLTLTRIG